MLLFSHLREFMSGCKFEWLIYKDGLTGIPLAEIDQNIINNFTKIVFYYNTNSIFVVFFSISRNLLNSYFSLGFHYLSIAFVGVARMLVKYVRAHLE